MQDYDKCGIKDENLCVDIDIDDVNLGEKNTQQEYCNTPMIFVCAFQFYICRARVLGTSNQCVLDTRVPNAISRCVF